MIVNFLRLGVKMKKLFFCLMAVILVVSMAFIGIGCKEAAPKEEAQAEEAEEAEEVEEAEPAEAAGEPKTIVYWTMWNQGEAMYDTMVELIDEYQAMNPGITIEVSYVGREIMAKLVAALGADEVVDIVEDEEFHIKPSLGEVDKLLTLDEAMSSPRYEGDITWRENFVTGSIDDENVVFVPYQVYTSGVTYNKTLWSDNGWEVPTTWDEFVALCETIKTTTDLAPLAQDGMVDRYNFWWYREILERLDGPGSVEKAIADKTGETWGDPNYLLGLEMIMELHDKDYFIEGIGGFVWPEGQGYFADGETAMIFCGSWLPFELKEAVDAEWEWGFFPFPEITGGKGSRTDMVLLSSGWSIMKNSKVANESIEFLKFMTSVDNSQRYGDASNMTLSVKEVVAPGVQIEVGEALATATSIYTWDVAPYQGDYHSGILLKNYQDAFLGVITPDEFIEKMKAETKEYWEGK